MNLPVSPEHLQLALTDECHVDDKLLPMTLRLRHIGDLILPTGQLVACDPVSCPEMGPFPLPFPQGTFPVILSLGQLYYRDELGQIIYEYAGLTVTFATIRFKQTMPVRWQLLLHADVDITTLKEGEYFGYGVDSAIGGFMDYSTGETMRKRRYEVEEIPPIWDQMMDEVSTNINNEGAGWFDMKFGDGNVIGFSSGEGDGVYATYAGFDADGDVAVVVTDFNVLQKDSVL